MFCYLKIFAIMGKRSEHRSSVTSQSQPLSCSRALLKSLVNSAVSRGDPALDIEQSSGISDRSRSRQPVSSIEQHTDPVQSNKDADDASEQSIDEQPVSPTPVLDLDQWDSSLVLSITPQSLSGTGISGIDKSSATFKHPATSAMHHNMDPISGHNLPALSLASYHSSGDANQ
uniref:Uncharacterized protein n=1 Tax=Romanomermis culicivorax TaxID=13658 RepID=A0A915KAU7_ROMCU